MLKSVMPTYEPLPYYMSAMGMQGARFLEGNDGTGSDDSDKSNESDDATDLKESEGQAPDEDKSKESGDKDSEGKGEDASGEDADADKSDDEFKSGESKKAVLADLRKARDERNTLRTENETLTESVSERDAVIATKDAEIASLKAEAQVSTLAATHGIVDEADVELLASISDEEKRTKLAERLAKDARNRVNRRVGASGKGTPAGSLDAGRDLYGSRKK